MTDGTTSHPSPQAATANAEQGDATGGIIPYKNPQALIAYYCGIFSLLPFIGILVGIPAFIFGILGLRHKKANPIVKGTVHAWIGILLGGLTTLLWGGFFVFAIYGALMSG